MGQRTEDIRLTVTVASMQEIIIRLTFTVAIIKEIRLTVTVASIRKSDLP